MNHFKQVARYAFCSQTLFIMHPAYLPAYCSLAAGKHRGSSSCSVLFLSLAVKLKVLPLVIRFGFAACELPQVLLFFNGQGQRMRMFILYSMSFSLVQSVLRLASLYKSPSQMEATIQYHITVSLKVKRLGFQVEL